LNLGRAKTILIIAFIGLNLFLGYQLFWPDFGRLTSVAVTTEEISAVENLLNDNNYYLETSIERGIKTSDFLKVSPDWETLDNLLEGYIERGAEVESNEDLEYYRLDDKVAIIHSSGLLHIRYSPGILLDENLYQDNNDLDKSELKDLAVEFLEEENLMLQDLIYDYMEQENDEQTVVFFKQELDDKPIYTGHFKVIIEKDRITALEAYWLKPIKRIPEREMEVIPASEALRNLVNKLGSSTDERSIEEIELGYYSEEYDAENWEIPPVWRIALDGSEYYYINAFTGNLEQEPVIPEKLPDDDNS